MLRIDEAERLAVGQRHRLREGEMAIAALRWLAKHGGSADLAINCHTASLCEGHREAMAYLNLALGEALAEVLRKAKLRAQADMDRLIGEAGR
jgi:hypothetical protein